MTLAVNSNIILSAILHYLLKFATSRSYVLFDRTI